MADPIDRRRFMKGALAAGVAATGFASLEEHILLDALARGADRRVGDLAGIAAADMPAGKLGSLTVSRLLAGGNLIGGWAHSRDLLYVSQLMKLYNTEERQFDTFELMEAAGVNTIQVDVTQLEVVNKYRKERGGKLQRIVSVRPLKGEWSRPQWSELTERITETLDSGADAVYIHGGYCDQLVQAAMVEGRRDCINFIGKVLEFIRERGVPAGIGSHALEVPVECEKMGVQPDFYFKTFHHDRYWSAHPRENRKPFSVDAVRYQDHGDFHDNIFDLDPEATAAYMQEKEQPWFAFKVMAAGAIDPVSAFRFAFENGADFVVAGMFDFQVAEDVRLVRDVLGSLRDRGRPWRA